MIGILVGALTSSISYAQRVGAQVSMENNCAAWVAHRDGALFVQWDTARAKWSAAAESLDLLRNLRDEVQQAGVTSNYREAAAQILNSVKLTSNLITNAFGLVPGMGPVAIAIREAKARKIVEYLSYIAEGGDAPNAIALDWAKDKFKERFPVLGPAVTALGELALDSHAVYSTATEYAELRSNLLRRIDYLDRLIRDTERTIEASRPYYIDAEEIKRQIDARCGTAATRDRTAEAGNTQRGAIASGPRYLGCFKDQGDPYGAAGRDLGGFSIMRDTSMTTEKCVAMCQGGGFAYAGTQYSVQCFCGNEYGRSGSAGNCNLPCAGNPSQTCGGVWANSIYQVPGR